MWNQIDRVVKAVSDATVGTVIVLVHVVLADRQIAKTAKTAKTAKALREARVAHAGEPWRLPS